ncbi:MAG: hypothetical protein LBE56_13360 [Tannerella sp.]|jgi:hypothetical protein|nr:hypothetical protein [Tannerella sp.]
MNREDKINGELKIENGETSFFSLNPQPSTLHSEDDVVFVPAEDIRAISRVIENWETVKQRWSKLRMEN